MNTLKDGEIAYVQGSGKKPYELKNVSGVFSCTCPAWRNQSQPLDVRTCKHLRKHLGDAHEDARIGKAPTASRPLAVGEAPDKKVKGKTIAEVKGTDVQEILDRAAKEGRKLRPDEKAKIAGAPVLLAHKFDHESDDPTGWWMSEKLDGVRAYWDGHNFISRQGNVYHAPDWFKAALPDHPLDGELWMGRGQFQKTLAVVRRLDGGQMWEDIRYMVYDAPHLDAPFEDRVKFLKSVRALTKGFGGSWAEAIGHEVVRSRQHLLDELKKQVAEGAEGLMLRQPGSLYEVGRSYTLLKVKPVDDDEAEVIGYTAGKGRHKGVVGALQCRLKNGVEFDLGTGLTDADRRDPPPIGSTVTFTYIGFTDDGRPKFASFLRVRMEE